MLWRWVATLPDARHIFGDEGTPRTLLQIVEGVGVRLSVRGRHGRTRLCGCHGEIPRAVGFTDASVLLEEGEADCTLSECFPKRISDFGGGGGGGGCEDEHRRVGWGFGEFRTLRIISHPTLQRYAKFLNPPNFFTFFFIFLSLQTNEEFLTFPSNHAAPVPKLLS